MKKGPFLETPETESLLYFKQGWLASFVLYFNVRVICLKNVLLKVVMPPPDQPVPL